MEENFEEIVDSITEQDNRYRREAYAFVLEAIDYCLDKLDARRHLTGREVLDAARELAIERFGMSAKMVFDEWGVKKTGDVGNIVFNMVDAGLLTKTPTDSIQDFLDVYDFEEEFVKKDPWA
jgi:uncharacterized repeat protein (TIGR04138 family)